MNHRAKSPFLEGIIPSAFPNTTRRLQPDECSYGFRVEAPADGKGEVYAAFPTRPSTPFRKQSRQTGSIIPPNKSFSLEVLIQPVFLQNWANKIGKWVSDEEYCFAAVDKDIIKSYMLLGFRLPLNLHMCPFLHLLMLSHLRLSCSE